jgi:hypothetical protein
MNRNYYCHNCGDVLLFGQSWYFDYDAGSDSVPIYCGLCAPVRSVPYLTHSPAGDVSVRGLAASVERDITSPPSKRYEFQPEGLKRLFLAVLGLSLFGGGVVALVLWAF